MSADRLSILCVSNMFPGPGDPDYGAFVADMCRELGEHGHDVKTAVIRTRTRGRLRSPLKYGSLGAATLARARRAEVIYAHYLFPTGALAAAAGHAHGVPWVITAHGRDVRNLEKAALRRASRPGIEGAGALIAVSEYLRERLSEHGFSLPQTHVVNMGVSLERFQIHERHAARSRLRLDGDGPIVLAVGGLTKRKNPLMLLRAFRRLFAEEPAARLVFVGDGPLAHEIDLTAANLGVAAAVIRPGSVPHDHVPDWMAASDVLAVVSTVEPLGQVALEALASGRPVVATSEGGTREIVPASGPGRHADPTDPDAIASALSELVGSPPDPQACRAAAAPHALEIQAERVAAILGGVLGP
ncbi:MAG: glycosyltransferase [Thermoleophilia bacterium]|nr:glycosyltransferase [Thermoleophilia bacterium]